MSRPQYGPNIGTILHDHGRKPGTRYLDLEMGNEFWNRMWVPLQITTRINTNDA